MLSPPSEDRYAGPRPSRLRWPSAAILWTIKEPRSSALVPQGCRALEAVRICAHIRA